MHFADIIFTSIKQTMSESGPEVGHLSVSLLLIISPSDKDNAALCDVHNLSMKINNIEGL